MFAKNYQIEKRKLLSKLFLKRDIEVEKGNERDRGRIREKGVRDNLGSKSE